MINIFKKSCVQEKDKIYTEKDLIYAERINHENGIRWLTTSQRNYDLLYYYNLIDHNAFYEIQVGDCSYKDVLIENIKCYIEYLVNNDNFKKEELVKLLEEAMVYLDD